MSQYDINWSARVYGGQNVRSGYAVCRAADGSSYVEANAANLAVSGRISGLALNAASDGGTFVLQYSGEADPSVTGLGAGAAENVGLDVNGRPVRVSDPAYVSGVHLLGTTDTFGVILMYATSSGVSDWPNIKDQFGAKGDGTTNDTAAFQAAFDAGGLIFVPDGVYELFCTPTTAALMCRRKPVTFMGASVLGTILRINSTVNGKGTGLLIERSGSPGETAESSIFRCFTISGGSNKPADLIVVHESPIVIEDVNPEESGRSGIIVESGTAGSTWGLSNLAGGTGIFADQVTLKRVRHFAAPSTFTSSATTVAANFVQPGYGGTRQIQVVDTSKLFPGGPVVITPAADVSNPVKPGAVYTIVSVDDATHVTLTWFGNPTSPWLVGATVPIGAVVQHGAGIICHGSDGHLGVIELCNGISTLVGFYDGSLAGNTYDRCYSQEGRCGYIFDGNSAVNKVDGCGSEDIGGNGITSTQVVVSAGNISVFEGGSLPIYIATNIANDGTSRVGPNGSSLQFQQQSSDGGLIQVYVPGGKVTNGANSARNFGHKYPAADPSIFKPALYQSGFSEEYWSSANYPASQWAWLWMHNTGIVRDLDAAHGGGALLITDVGNIMGPGCVGFPAPLANTPFRWKWAQTGLTIATGFNKVWLFGGVGTDSGNTTSSFAVADAKSLIGVCVGTLKGTTPPLITFSGTPTNPTGQVWIHNINVSGGNGLGQAKFDWDVYQPDNTNHVAGTASGSGVTTAANVVLGTTGITANFPAGPYATDNQWLGQGIWGRATWCVKAHLQFADDSALNTAGQVYVSGTAPGATHTQNWVAGVYNNSGNPISNATLVWEFDIFCTNYIYSAGSGNVG